MSHLRSQCIFALSVMHRKIKKYIIENNILLKKASLFALCPVAKNSAQRVNIYTEY